MTEERIDHIPPNYIFLVKVFRSLLLQPNYYDCTYLELHCKDWERPHPGTS
jgi:hypothetical protein